MKYLAVSLLALTTILLPAAELPQWDISTLSDLDAQWGAPEKDGDISYRSAKPGKKASLKVPVWWGDDFRPAHGTVYILEVFFKDTVKVPAIFCCRSGLSQNGSELHRFGGAADNKWKTAAVPVSWDLICRLKDDNRTGFSIHATGDELPVSKISVRLATDGDAEKYFQETRAWIAEDIKRQFPDVKAEAAKDAVIPEKMKGQLLIPFVTPYTVNILSDTAPADGAAGAALKTRMTLDEFEPLAFGVYANGRDAKDVTFDVSELRGPNGKLDCQIELLTAEYYPIKNKQNAARLTPLRLWPRFPIDIPAGQSRAFWIILKTIPEKSRPGRYSGTVVVRTHEESTQFPLNLEVLPLKLLTMDEIGMPFGGCVATLPPEQEMDTYRDHNQRAMHIFYGNVHPNADAEDGKLTLDFSNMDEWMHMAADKGITDVLWFLGGDPYLYPDSLELERDLYRCSLKKVERPGWREKFVQKANAMQNDPGIIPAVRPLYTQWIQQVTAHAAEKKWPRVIFVPFDEAAKWPQRTKGEDNIPILGSGPWVKTHFKELASAIHAASKNALVCGEMQDAKAGVVFLPDVDIFCTNAIRLDPDLGNKVRAAGKIFWQYSGCNSKQSASFSRYGYGFYFAAFDGRGGLQWAMNWGPHFCAPGPGDSMYSWYTPFGTIVSPVYEGLREGMDDRRIIETYKKQFANDSAALERLKKLLDNSIHWRAQAGNDTVNNFFNTIDNVEAMDQWKNQLLDELVHEKTAAK